jgi:Amt family ammonium transporter
VRTANAKKSLLHINIDQLHIINDTVGHATGDEIIRSVASTIDSIRRDSDTLSRLGGDEFGVLLHGCSSNEAAEFAERICHTIEKSTIDFDGERYKVTVSIGVAMITPLSKSVAQVIGGAELACSVAKEQGQNRVEVYRLDNVDVLRREEQVHSVAQIQNALASNSFELYCQPIQALAPDDHDHHTEVLLRLIDDDGKVVEPDKFIPAAERYHLMPSVDCWVISRTLAMLSQFDERALVRGTFAINLSGQSLGENGFLEFVHSEIKKAGIPPSCICFEVTETAAVAKMDKAVAFMLSVRDIGCSFSLDDFGSGTSSFGYLKSLPVDYLKIDGAIIRDMATDETSAAMVLAINQVGHAMNLRTIAEYVETPAIMLRLQEIGVDYAQGFEIGRPVPFADRLQEIMVTPAAVAS